MKVDAVCTLSVPSFRYTRAADQVNGVKARLAQLCARDNELTTVIERAIAERQAVRTEMASVKDELDALVSAPVSDGLDPTLSLPDELMEEIFLMVPLEELFGGVCERVCGLSERALS